MIDRMGLDFKQSSLYPTTRVLQNDDFGAFSSSLASPTGSVGLLSFEYEVGWVTQVCSSEYLLAEPGIPREL
jgi:hypothetical protein